ncbi:MAG TPA: universal stress protein [Gemmatimonadales bacterium]|nr:universal stress protein [Gemmatimonadales bacterium]
MRILLAIDDSTFSEAATQAVLRQMRPEEHELHVLHVVEPIDSYPSYSHAVHHADLERAQQTLVKHAKDLVARVERLLREAGFTVHTAVEEGDPRTAIVDYAANRKCDLIVLGSHGRTGLDRFLMGSVAEFVARHGSCWVQIVRTPRTKRR